MRDIETEYDTSIYLQVVYESIEKKIRQRLRWAAGANPSTGAVLDKFEGAIGTRLAALAQV